MMGKQGLGGVGALQGDGIDTPMSPTHQQSLQRMTQHSVVDVVECRGCRGVSWMSCSIAALQDVCTHNIWGWCELTARLLLALVSCQQAYCSWSLSHQTAISSSSSSSSPHTHTHELCSNIPVPLSSSTRTAPRSTALAWLLLTLQQEQAAVSAPERSTSTSLQANRGGLWGVFVCICVCER